MRVVARRTEGFAHEVEIDDGAHRITVDEPPDAGGAGTGPSPTRLLAAGLASCVAITIEMYAERQGWDLGAVEVEAEVAYDGHVPTDFDLAIRLPAELDEERRRRLLVVAGKCPVHRALSGDAPVRISDRIEAA